MRADAELVDAGIDAELVDAGIELVDAGMDAELVDGGIDVELVDAGIDAEMVDAGIDAEMAETAGPEEQPSFKFDPVRSCILVIRKAALMDPFLAVDENVTGGMLSAAGGNIAISLEQKKRPLIRCFRRNVFHVGR